MTQCLVVEAIDGENYTGSMSVVRQRLLRAPDGNVGVLRLFRRWTRLKILKNNFGEER